jgi:hypothetical protein
MSGCNFQARGPALATLVALFLASTILGQEAIVSARIVGITDGDTVKALLASNELLRVRLSWIDAPEKSQAIGQRSKQHLSELVFGRQVELHTHAWIDTAALWQSSSSTAWTQTLSDAQRSGQGLRAVCCPSRRLIFRRATDKPRLKHGSSDADSGVSAIPFRHGNIGAGKKSKLAGARLCASLTLGTPFLGYTLYPDALS